MKAFTANFSDLSGASNPNGVWSPAFLSLKLALDKGEQPDTVVQALYDWLSQRKIKPSEVDAVLDLDADAAYDALVRMVYQSARAEGLPKLVKDTLRRAIGQIAGNYVTKQTQELERQRARLSGIRSRFKTESAQVLADRLLE